MNRKLQKMLEGIGLDEKESLVYLSCLQLTNATNADIARKTGLNRITNYEVLKRLQKRGMITSFKRCHVTHFRALDPRLLIGQAKERVQFAEESLPELLAVANDLEKKPKISFFEGLEGIKQLYKDSLTAHTNLLTFTNAHDLYALLGEYEKKYLAERVQRKIPVLAVCPDNEDSRAAKKQGPSVIRQVRLVPQEKYALNNEIMIYDNKLAIYSSEDEIGLLIENKELVETFKNIWHMAWDNAEKYE